MLKILRAALPHSRVFWGAMTIVAAYSGLVVFLFQYLPHIPSVEAKDITAVSSLAVGLIFAFRVNSAYDRWWEGRKLWGQLVNDLRNLSIKFDLYFDADEKSRRDFGNLLITFAFALKHHLRSRHYNLAWAGLSAPEQPIANVPLHIATLIYESVEKSRKESSHERLQLLLLDTHMKALMDICGACERIRNTPIAGWFQASIWIWLITYLTLLPWLLCDEFHKTTVLIVLFAAYFGIALELLAEDMQEPFGCDQNDLPTDAICLNIAASVQQVLYERPENTQSLDGIVAT
jgi:ion channel-forming bestrophin family protein